MIIKQSYKKLCECVQKVSYDATSSIKLFIHCGFPLIKDIEIPVIKGENQGFWTIVSTIYNTITWIEHKNSLLRSSPDYFIFPVFLVLVIVVLRAHITLILSRRGLSLLWHSLCHKLSSTLHHTPIWSLQLKEND